MWHNDCPKYAENYFSTFWLTGLCHESLYEIRQVGRMFCMRAKHVINININNEVILSFAGGKKSAKNMDELYFMSKSSNENTRDTSITKGEMSGNRLGFFCANKRISFIYFVTLSVIGFTIFLHKNRLVHNFFGNSGLLDYLLFHSPQSGVSFGTEWYSNFFLLILITCFVYFRYLLFHFWSQVMRKHCHAVSWLDLDVIKMPQWLHIVKLDSWLKQIDWHMSFRWNHKL